MTVQMAKTLKDKFSDRRSQHPLATTRVPNARICYSLSLASRPHAAGICQYSIKITTGPALQPSFAGRNTLPFGGRCRTIVDAGTRRQIFSRVVGKFTDRWRGHGNHSTMR